MNFIQSIKICFEKYADFSGRSARSEFWYFSLFIFIGSIIAEIIDAAILDIKFWEYQLPNGPAGHYGPAGAIFLIAGILPLFSVTVRRLHDASKSGYWILLAPTVIGLVYLIYWCLQPSGVGANQFGADPLDQVSKRQSVPRWALFALTPIVAVLTWGLGKGIVFSVTENFSFITEKAHISASKDSWDTDFQKAPRYTNIKFGTYHALVIGNNHYKHLKDLDTAVNDATKVSNLLKKKYGFRTTLLTDANRSQTLKALNNLVHTLHSKDNLLIYYAGHGAYDELTKSGYWQPVNAEEKDNTEWIANDTITKILITLPANNVFVVADSCYSGTVFRGLSVPKDTSETKEQLFTRLINKKTRVALTSGGNEPVADAVFGSQHSIFAKSFIKILKNNGSVLTANQFAETLKERVIPEMESNNLKQTPEYSHMYSAGHDGGDFLFVPKVLVRRD